MVGYYTGESKIDEVAKSGQLAIHGCLQAVIVRPQTSNCDDRSGSEAVFDGPVYQSNIQDGKEYLVFAPNKTVDVMVHLYFG